MKKKSGILITTILGLVLTSCSINLNTRSESNDSNSETKTSENSSENSSEKSSQRSSETNSVSESKGTQTSSTSTLESSTSSSNASTNNTTPSESSSSISTSTNTSTNSSSSSTNSTTSSSQNTDTTLTLVYIIDSKVYKSINIVKDETISLETPTKDHYTFDGWYLDENFSTKFNGTSIDTSINLYGHFEAQKCSVVYYASEEVFKTETFDYGSSLIKTESVPTKDGYNFIGWSEDKNSTTLFDFNTEITTDLALYAIFEKNTITLTSEGYNEGLYATFSDFDASKTKVYIAAYNSDDLVYEAIDSSLIRQIDESTTRVDVLGLTKGTYILKVVKSDSTCVYSDAISVSNHDRSGYAHFSYTSDGTGVDVSDGIGAYKNDGTLKSGAVVVYVTDETKNTVTATINNKTYTGLANILQAQSKSNVALDIRLIGSINAATWNKIDYKTSSTTTISPSNVYGVNNEALEQKNYTEEEIISGGYNTLECTYTKLNGLTNKIKYDSSKNEFDSYYNMLDISNAKNVTVEGIGEDATIFQWGFTWKNCSSIEVRNITFDSYTEDACSFEGSDDSKTLNGFKSGHIWIHNNTFNEGHNNWDVCNEQDKHEGDGATDFKKNAFITLSYNYYYKNHKTGLVGGSDSQHTACITFHHNFYDTCKSRLPLARQANMHMYNNYYYNSQSYSMSIRANGYAFVENCYFENGQNPYELQTSSSNGDGYIKVYGCEFTNIKISNTNYQKGNTVQSRDEVVTNTNLYGTTFDTDSTLFYYKDGKSNVENLTSASLAKEECLKYSGVLKSHLE